MAVTAAPPLLAIACASGGGPGPMAGTPRDLGPAQCRGRTSLASPAPFVLAHLLLTDWSSRRTVTCAIVANSQLRGGPGNAQTSRGGYNRSPGQTLTPS